MFLRSFLVRGVGRRRCGEGRPHEDEEEEAAHFLSRHHRCSVDRSSLLLSPLTVSLGDVKTVFFGAHMILLGSDRTISLSLTSWLRFHITVSLPDFARAPP